MNIREKIKGLSTRNKVLISIFALGGVLALGGEIITIVKLRWEIAQLEERIEYYKERFQADSTLLQNLHSPEFLERFAREHYHMHAKGEEVYIIREK
jgi:cell division protein FtsB